MKMFVLYFYGDSSVGIMTQDEVNYMYGESTITKIADKLEIGEHKEIDACFIARLKDKTEG